MNLKIVTILLVLFISSSVESSCFAYLRRLL